MRSPDIPDLSFAVADPTRPPACRLLASMTAELNRLYVTDDRLSVPTLAPAELTAPDGTFLIGRLGRRPVAGGGVRRLGPSLGEIKRMYVVPEQRGRGIAGALLAALEEAARGFGYTTVRLDTGPLQSAAQELYLRAGYVPIASYNDNPYASFWGEKSLGAVGAVGARRESRSEST